MKEKGFTNPAIDRLRFANPLYGLMPLPLTGKAHQMYQFTYSCQCNEV